MNSEEEDPISTQEDCSTYVSCIKVNGKSILPPLMTDAKRTEMRRYKELAIALEARLKNKKLNDETKSLSKKDILTAPSNPTQPNDIPITSETSPRILTETQNKMDATEDSLRPCNDVGYDQHFVIKKSFGTNPFKENLSPTVPEEMESNNKSQSDESSSDIFASAPSSTGTFIIKGNDIDDNSSQSLDDDEEVKNEERSEGEVSSDEDGFDGKDDGATSASEHNKESAKEELILCGKRKRPAFYFDEAVDDGEESDEENSDDDDDDKSQATNGSTTYAYSEGDSKGGMIGDSSISLNPFLPSDVTWSSSISKSSVATAGTDPNVSIHSVHTEASHQTPSRTETFDNKENENVEEVETVQRRKFFSSPRPFEVTLSTKIPSSAENTPVKKTDQTRQDESVSKQEDNVDADSDKDNHDKSTSKSSGTSSTRKHVRKLSYTLDEPSDALLASGMKINDGNCDIEFFNGALSTIPSSNATPLKYTENTQVPSTPTAEDLDKSLETLDRHLEQLQVGVAVSKKRQLEKYIDDVSKSTQKVSSPATGHAASTSTPTAEFEKEIEEKFNELQAQQKKQLEYLMNVHREQEYRLREDFERQRSFLLEQLKSMSTCTSPSRSDEKNKNVHPSTLPLSSLAITPSNFRNGNDNDDSSTVYYTPANTSTSANNNFSLHINSTSIYQRSSRSIKNIKSQVGPYVASLSSTASTPRSDMVNLEQNTDTDSKSIMSSSTTTNTLTELSSVGLSKLQTKMKALSPKYLKMGGDPRSPLLKGVAFPSPLNRSHAPVRVPTKALEPEMKLKFCRVTACVRGYLTRRLLHTDKIQTIIQTIRDTVDFVLKLYEENPNNPTHLQIKPEDLNLHRLLIQQLNGACSSFHGIFFKLSTPERMAIIATDRQKLKAKAVKEQLSYNNSNSGSNKCKKNISTATLKAMERRLSFGPNALQLQLHPPRTPHYQTGQKLSTLPSSSTNNIVGSRSVNPKPVSKSKFCGVSPSTKRRRISHYVFKPPKNVTSTINTGLPKNKGVKNSMTNVATPKFARPSAIDQNANKWKPRPSNINPIQASGSQASTASNNHNVTYTTFKGIGSGFPPNPARIETNFCGSNTPLQNEQIFNTYLASATKTKVAPSSSTVPESAKRNLSNLSTSTHSSASSARFSIGSNNSSGTGYSLSSKQSISRSTTGQPSRPSIRKSVSRNTRPCWK